MQQVKRILIACWSRVCLYSIVVLAALWAGNSAFGQRVSAELSAREAYVGQPVILEIQIINAATYSTPSAPAIDGLEIQSVPTPFNSVSVINGHKTTINGFRYRVIPQRTGEFRIPPIDVDMNGRTQTTPELFLIVADSETGDLMFAAVADGPDKVYVGQPVELNLKLWIRPFVDRQRNIKLSEETMWKLVDPRSDWGFFQEAIDEMAANRQRPVGTEVLREDNNGNRRAYYLFEVEGTVYPQRPGEIQPGNVSVVVSYPTELSDSRSRFGMFGDNRFGPSMFDDMLSGSLFGPSLKINSVRPISANAQVSPIPVLDVPTAGRPMDYRGAVGTYRIATQAEPTTVNEGDPITLRIVIQGDGPMELVQPPPLGMLPKLTEGFKIADDELAGFVQDDAKLFTTTLRPLRSDVNEIPPIPLSFFNPQTEQFETVYSDPISISVTPAETLSLDAIVSSIPASEAKDLASPAPSTKPSKVPERGLYSADAILSSNRYQPALTWAFAVPPLVWAICIVLKKRSTLMSRLSAYQNPEAIAIRAIRRATSASEIVSVLEHTQCDTKSEEFREVLAQCNHAAFAPTSAVALPELKRRVLRALRSNNQRGARVAK